MRCAEKHQNLVLMGDRTGQNEKTKKLEVSKPKEDISHAGY